MTPPCTAEEEAEEAEEAACGLLKLKVPFRKWKYCRLCRTPTCHYPPSAQLQFES